MKGYQCDVCQQVLSTKGHLTRHMKRHTGLKKHECPIVGCDYKSARRDNTKVHFEGHKRKFERNGVAYELKEPEDDWKKSTPTTPESLSPMESLSPIETTFLYPFPTTGYLVPYYGDFTQQIVPFPTMENLGYQNYPLEL